MPMCNNFKTQTIIWDLNLVLHQFYVGITAFILG